MLLSFGATMILAESKQTFSESSYWSVRQSITSPGHYGSKGDVIKLSFGMLTFFIFCELLLLENSILPLFTKVSVFHLHSISFIFDLVIAIILDLMLYQGGRHLTALYMTSFMSEGNKQCKHMVVFQSLHFFLSWV